MAPPQDEISAGSILRELIFNQYQAIVAAGAVAASALTLNPLPLLLWLGSELVLQLQQPLLLRNWGIDANRYQIHVAQRNRDISEVQYKQTVLNTVANVKQLYYDLIYANDNLAAQRQSLALATKLVEENRRRDRHRAARRRSAWPRAQRPAPLVAERGLPRLHRHRPRHAARLGADARTPRPRHRADASR